MELPKQRHARLALSTIVAAALTMDRGLRLYETDRPQVFFPKIKGTKYGAHLRVSQGTAQPGRELQRRLRSEGRETRSGVLVFRQPLEDGIVVGYEVQLHFGPFSGLDIGGDGNY